MVLGHQRSRLRDAVLAAALLVCGAAAGCGTEGEEIPEPGIADVVIGGADASGTGYLPLEDGDEVELVPGAQGGYHVYIGMEMQGAMGTLYVDRDARKAEDGTLVLRTNLHTVEVPETAMETYWQKPNAFTTFMCPSPIGVVVVDEPIEYRVAVLDEDEAVLGEDTITLTPRCPDGDLNEHCMRICSGL